MGNTDGVVKALMRSSDGFARDANFGPEALWVNRRLTELVPKSARYWFRLGRCLKFDGQPGKAKKAFKRGLEIDTQYLARIKLDRGSDGFTEAGDSGPRARGNKRTLTKADRESAGEWSRKGGLLKAGGELEEARKAFDRVLEIDPDHMVARNQLREIDLMLVARREVSVVFAGGSEALKSLIASTKNSPGKTRLRLEGRRLLNEQPGASARDRLGLAREVGRSGEHEEALDLYRKAFREGGRDVQAAALVGAAAVLRRMDQPKQAEKLCRQVLRTYPRDVPALTTLGSAMQDQNRRAEAEEAFEATRRAEWQSNLRQQVVVGLSAP
jgi:tetratricopeptide (TPR) repeat protein